MGQSGSQQKTIKTKVSCSQEYLQTSQFNSATKPIRTSPSSQPKLRNGHFSNSGGKWCICTTTWKETWFSFSFCGACHTEILEMHQYSQRSNLQSIDLPDKRRQSEHFFGKYRRSLSATSSTAGSRESPRQPSATKGAWEYFQGLDRRRQDVSTHSKSQRTGQRWNNPHHSPLENDGRGISPIEKLFANECFDS